MKLKKMKTVRKIHLTESQSERCRNFFKEGEYFSSGFVWMSKYKTVKTKSGKKFLFLENPKTKDFIVHEYNEDNKIFKTASNKKQLLKY